MNTMSKTVLFACGGTGGHIFPAVAIAEACVQEYGAKICFAGRRNSMEERILRSKYDFFEISAVPLKRGKIIENMLLPIRLVTSIVSGIKAIRQSKADVVVGTGGYVSLPVVLAAWMLSIPVYIQEQNSVAGIANSIGVKIAKKVFVASESVAQVFGKKKSVVSGNPVRALPDVETLIRPQEYMRFPQKKNVLVLGGSQGAKGINEKLLESLSELKLQNEFMLVWQVGEKNVEAVAQKVAGIESIVVKGFIENVYAYMHHADIIVSRSGASTLAEILVLGKPSILIPFPFATANHQEHNARELEKAGAALVELESEQNSLVKKIEALIDAPAELEKMKNAAGTLAKPDAAYTIAKTLYQLERTV